MKRLKWNIIAGHLEIALILMQDRCTVCAERTIGSKIVLDAPDTIGLKIILDAPDGTPK